ncbi:MAG: NADH-quinone oxidoreductase [Frankiales bacterium]|nr:NADH-quinone oxidoreductase [Frankiales bacterium]
MQVVEVTEYGGPEVLRLAERPDPEPGPGQVLVRVAAAPVNPADLWIRGGVVRELTDHLPHPLVLGWDVAGEVLALGTGVSNFQVGQQVAGMISWFATGVGAYAEQVVVDASWLAALPEGADPVATSTIPVNGETAATCLDEAGLSAGQTLLVTGASGAVGGFVVELAVRAGLRVLASASTGDEDHVSALGPAEVLPRGSDLSGLGVDAVIDAAVLRREALAAVRDGGRFVSVSPPRTPRPERDIDVRVITVLPDGERLATLLSAGLTPRVAQLLPLGEAARGHTIVAAGGLRGKVVLLP